jgi:hypothetical protein
VPSCPGDLRRLTAGNSAPSSDTWRSSRPPLRSRQCPPPIGPP